jgi:transposase-like protein
MLDVRIKVRLLLLDARCPSCSSSNLRPGLVRAWVEGPLLRIWLFLTMRRPYLCRDCDDRFYDFRFKSSRLPAYEDEVATILEEYVPPMVADASPQVELPAVASDSQEIAASNSGRTA